MRGTQTSADKQKHQNHVNVYKKIKTSWCGLKWQFGGQHMNKVEKKIKRKKWAEKKTDNVKKKRQLLEDILSLTHYQEAIHEYTTNN